jgi:hypothetical protein
MKDIYEVLRLKEYQSEQLQKEIEALRLAIKILDEADVPTKSSEFRTSPIAPLEGAFVASVNSAKRFP